MSSSNRTLPSDLQSNLNSSSSINPSAFLFVQSKSASGSRRYSAPVTLQQPLLHAHCRQLLELLRKSQDVANTLVGSEDSQDLQTDHVIDRQMDILAG